MQFRTIPEMILYSLVKEIEDYENILIEKKDSDDIYHDILLRIDEKPNNNTFSPEEIKCYGMHKINEGNLYGLEKALKIIENFINKD